MSTLSQHMGIKIPDGSDPFLRTDFVQNYNTLDKYPGNWICTSTTRPNWGAGQAGMCITETNTRRTMMWTGSTWREMLYGSAVWYGSTRPQVQVGPGTSVTYIVGTFTVNRPGSLFGMTTSEVALPTRGYTGATNRLMLDGMDANFDGPHQNGEYVGTDFPNNSTFGSKYWTANVASIGVRNISAGTHSIGLRFTTMINANSTARLVSIRAMAMFVNATDR